MTSARTTPLARRGGPAGGAAARRAGAQWPVLAAALVVMVLGAALVGTELPARRARPGPRAGGRCRAGGRRPGRRGPGGCHRRHRPAQRPGATRFARGHRHGADHGARRAHAARREPVDLALHAAGTAVRPVPRGAATSSTPTPSPRTPPWSAGRWPNGRLPRERRLRARGRAAAHRRRHPRARRGSHVPDGCDRRRPGTAVTVVGLVDLDGSGDWARDRSTGDGRVPVYGPLLVAPGTLIDADAPVGRPEPGRGCRPDPRRAGGPRGRGPRRRPARRPQTSSWAIRSTTSPYARGCQPSSRTPAASST